MSEKSNPAVQAQGPGCTSVGSAGDTHTDTPPVTRDQVRGLVPRAVGWRHAAGGAQIVAHYQRVTPVDPHGGAVASVRQGEPR
jgi:hypothetical protein